MDKDYHKPLTILPTSGRWLLNQAKNLASITGRGLGLWRLVSLGSYLFSSWRDCPVVGPDGKEFWLDLRGKGFGGWIVSGWCVSGIEPTLQHLDPHSVILDIGANVGVWTRLFAAYAPAGQVYAFEPSASTFARLYRNNSPLENVTCINCAVGCETTIAAFSTDDVDSCLRHIEVPSGHNKHCWIPACPASCPS